MKYLQTRHSEPRWPWLLALLLVLGACQSAEVKHLPGSEKQAGSSQTQAQPEVAQVHLARALLARDAGDYAACHELFAQAARASVVSSTSAPHWYEAALCAARSGAFQASIFYLNAAASSGFTEVQRLLQEPLFRALHSDARWPLLVDLVLHNDRNLHNDRTQTASDPGKSRGLSASIRAPR